MARKTEVYTWRVSATIKADLEEVARASRTTVAQVLNEIVVDHLQGAHRGRGGEADQEQRRLHLRAAHFAGSMASGDANRAEKARDLVRARLRSAALARRAPRAR
jgi:hypothetical protein